MSKSLKNYREKENERVHGKIAYRERIAQSKDAEEEIKIYLAAEDFIEFKDALDKSEKPEDNHLLQKLLQRKKRWGCENSECYCTGKCKEGTV